MGLLFEQNVTLLVWKSPRAQCEFFIELFENLITLSLYFTFVMTACLKFY